jgi:hypothetical protein
MLKDMIHPTVRFRKRKINLSRPIWKKWPCYSPPSRLSLNKLCQSIVFNLRKWNCEDITLLSFNFWTSVETLESFPSMDEYHRILSRRIRLSWIIRETNATSPPMVHISPGDPVHDFYYFHLECTYRKRFHRFRASVFIQFSCVRVEWRITHAKVQSSSA